MKSKKLLSILCLLALTACGSNTSSTDNSSTQQESTSVAPSSEVLSNSSTTAESSSSDVSSEISSEVSSEVSSDTSSESSPTTPDPIVEYAALADFKCYNLELKLTNAKVGSKFEVGSTVTLNFSCDRIYKSDIDGGYYYILVNNKKVELSYNAEENPSISFGYLSSLYAEFEVENTDDLYIYSIGSINNSSADGYTVTCAGGKNYTLIGNNEGEKYTSFNFAIANKKGYKVDRVYYIAEGQTEEVEVTSGRRGQYYIYLESNITLYVVMAEATISSIIFENADNLDLERSTYVLEATEGDSVLLDMYAKAGYYIDSVSVDATSQEEGIWASSYTSFTMPNHDVTFTFSIKENIRVNIAEHSKIAEYKIFDDYELTNETTGYAPGGKLYITATAVEGYTVSNIYALNNETGEEVYSDFYNGKASIYTTPDCGMTIFFEVAQAKAVTLSATEGGVATFANGSTTAYFLPGDQVEFTVQANEGYKVKSVKTSDDTYVSSYDSTFYFYMGENETEVIIEFELITYATVTLSALVGDLTRVEVEGFDSGVSLKEGSSDKFQVGEYYNIYFFASSNKYNYSAKITDGDEVTTHEFTEGMSGNILELQIKTNNVSIELIAEEKTAVSVNITTPTDSTIEIEWYVNDEKVETLPNIYANDTISFEIITPAGDGFKYVVTCNGETTNNYRWDVQGDIAIEISKIAVQLAKFEIINESSQSNDVVTYSYIDYSDIDEGGLEVGKTLSIQNSRWNNTICEIWVGDELITTLTTTYGSNTYKLDITSTATVKLVIKDAA